MRRAVIEALGRLTHPAASAYVLTALDGRRRRRSGSSRSACCRGSARAALARPFAELAPTIRRTAVRRAAEIALRRMGKGRDDATAGRRNERFGSDALGVPSPACRCCANSFTSAPACSSTHDRTRTARRAHGAAGRRRAAFDRSSTLYYLLKYDEAAAPAAWRQVMDALSVPETYFWREIDQIRGDRLPRRAGAGAPRRAAPMRIWSAPCATGEEPLTIAMALKEAGWFERRADRDPRQRRAARRRSPRRGPGATGRGRCARCRRRCARNILPPTTARSCRAPSWRGAITSWSVVNLMVPEEVAPYARGPDRVLPQRVHLFLAAGHQARRRSVRRADADARLSVRRRLGIAAQRHHRVLARGDRAGVRLREAGQPMSEIVARPRSSTTRPTCGR